MALPSVTNTTGIGPDTAASATDAKAQKAALDRDAFLKLLVAQLSHQDPLQPMEGTEFVAQLSQFAMVEQAIAQSAKLDVLSTQMTGLASNEATSLVGKVVSVRGSGIAFDGVSATGASVTLAGPAAKVTVRIQDASGQTVRTLELGARGPGAVAVAWDGKDDAGQPVPKGSYSVKVDAQAAEGTPVGVSQDAGGRVVKVTFDNGYPELHLDSGVTAPISDLVSVGGDIR